MVLSQASTEQGGNSFQGSTKVREWLGPSEWESSKRKIRGYHQRLLVTCLGN